MYAYRKIDKKVEDKRCKGTRKCVFPESLTFDDYKACLFNGKTIYREQMLFENKKHTVYTVNKPKIALNRDDGKGLIQADGITTLARGCVAHRLNVVTHQRCFLWPLKGYKNIYTRCACLCSSSIKFVQLLLNVFLCF